MAKIDERIEQINIEHEELLKMVREKIEYSGKDFANCSNEIMKFLRIDEKIVKKSKSLQKIEQTIIELVKEISKAKTLEDIERIRKQLNRNIYKINKILQNRQVPASKINEFTTKSSYLRKNIATYVRFLKRETNLDANEANLKKINELYANYENLNAEQIRELRTRLSREKTYNRRNKKSLINESSSKVITSSEVPTRPTNRQTSSSTEIAISYSNLKDEREIKPTSSSTEVAIMPLSIQDQLIKTRLLSHISQRVHSLDKTYDIRDIKECDSEKISERIFNFLSNIPNYINNKKIIEEFHKARYYYGADYIFSKYIMFQEQNNSITQGLRTIFMGTHLSNEQKTCKNNHEKCVSFIVKLFTRNELSYMIGALNNDGELSNNNNRRLTKTI